MPTATWASGTRAERSSSTPSSRRPGSRSDGTTRRRRNPRPGNSLLVEFTLEGDGEQTRLTVVESGLDLLGWSTTEKQRYADEHNGGWGEYLDRLARLLAERPRG